MEAEDKLGKPIYHAILYEQISIRLYLMHMLIISYSIAWTVFIFIFVVIVDRLDGLAKKKNEAKPQTMEDFLQVPDYYNMEDTSGKKRVCNLCLIYL